MLSEIAAAVPVSEGPATTVAAIAGPVTTAAARPVTTAAGAAAIVTTASPANIQPSLMQEINFLKRKDRVMSAKLHSLTSYVAALNSRVSHLNYKVVTEHRYGSFGEDFKVDLSPGGSYGRLYVQMKGTWGSVCDDFFDYNDAKVVCRQLGYSGGSKYYSTWGHNSTTNVPILLDDLNCRGNEASLSLCPARKRGWHNCSHGEDVWMSCTKNRGVTRPRGQ